MKIDLYPTSTHWWPQRKICQRYNVERSWNYFWCINTRKHKNSSIFFFPRFVLCKWIRDSELVTYTDRESCKFSFSFFSRCLTRIIKLPVCNHVLSSSFFSPIILSHSPLLSCYLLIVSFRSFYKSSVQYCCSFNQIPLS